MSDEEQIEMMRMILLKDVDDDSKDELFEIYLKNALAILLNTLFPFDKEAEISDDDFRLRNWQVRCAIELYNSTDRSGVETYSENGLSVTYFANLVSQSLLNELTSRAGCPKAKETIVVDTSEVDDEEGE